MRYCFQYHRQIPHYGCGQCNYVGDLGVQICPSIRIHNSCHDDDFQRMAQADKLRTRTSKLKRIINDHR